MRAWRFPRRMSPSEPASGAPSDCRLGRVSWAAAELSRSNCVERPSQNKRLRRLNSAGGTCATRGRRKNKRCGAAGPIGRVSTRRVLCRPHPLLLRAKCVGHSAAGPRPSGCNLHRPVHCFWAAPSIDPCRCWARRVPATHEPQHLLRWRYGRPHRAPAGRHPLDANSAVWLPPAGSALHPHPSRKTRAVPFTARAATATGRETWPLVGPAAARRHKASSGVGAAPAAIC